MSPTQTAARKSAGARARASQTLHARIAENDRLVKRIASSLEAARGDLGKLGGSVEAGVADLRTSLTRLLRDAQREAAKLSQAVRTDLDRLPKGAVAAAAKPKATKVAGKGRAAAKKASGSKAKPKAKKAAAKGRAAAKPRAASKAKATKAKATKAKATKAKATKAKAKAGAAAKAKSRTTAKAKPRSSAKAKSRTASKARSTRRGS